ncbi:Retrovirus-related Pol polyprotein from transposon opus [Gossypium australe]|uniref:Retrovirus-related Pol polyprotein from transposon opus n=1 Tax=Gossypium australe TaxID=47621 RepID=A0A5B6W699_9ROSI|nr:Retrovirus-related Pol polyprotein from transposon opus [Gossypium australe]
MEIRDRKDTENHVADHLSRLKAGNEYGNIQMIKDEFPDEQLLTAMVLPYGLLPPELSILLDEPLLFKQCAHKSFEDVFRMIKFRVFYSTVIQHHIEAILGVYELLQKFSSLVFISQACLKTLMNSVRSVIAVKELEIYLGDMKCPCIIF